MMAVLFQLLAGSPEPTLAIADQTVPGPAPVTPATPTATSAKPDDRNELRCRIEPTTGSRFGKKVCSTPQEAYETSQEAKKTLERMQGAKTLPVG